MIAFVGAERERLVGTLVSELDACVEESRPHLACITAEAGWGKTRIVHEFYRRLQERQDPPKYWPCEFGTGDEDPMRDRKVIYPSSIDPEPGARMPWFWWGLRCEEDSGGRKVRALFNDRGQMRAHLSGLIAAADRKTARRALALTVLGEAVGLTPGVGQALSLAVAGREAYTHLKSGIGRRRERDGADDRRRIDVGRPDGSEIEPELELVRQFISKDLPLVLAVDDAHDADPGTVEFLRQVLSFEAPILVVATAWPSELDDQAQCERDVPPPDRALFGGLLSGVQDERPESVSRHDLSPLAGPDLADIINQVAPGTRDEAREALVENSGGNPLVLRLQLTSPRVIRSVADGAITLSARELEQLPRGYSALIGDRYFDLPEPEQCWLAEAAHQGERFFPETLPSSLEPLDAELLSAFVRISTDEAMPVGRFIEGPVHRGVLVATESEYPDAERERWDTASLRALERYWGDDRPLPGDLSTRQDLCGLTVRYGEQAGEGDVDATVISAAARSLSFAEQDLEHYAAELDAARVAMRWADREPRDAQVRVLAAMRLSSACRANNHVEDAVAAARLAVSITEDGGQDATGDRCAAWGHLAYALTQADDLEGAARAAAEAHSAAVADHELIWTLRTVAMVEAEAGRHDAAVEALTEALGIARAVQPPDLEEVIEIETEITSAGPSFASPDRWRAHAKAAEEHLGAGHGVHRLCLSLLGWRLLQDGDMDAAGAVFDRLEELEEQSPAGDATSLASLHRSLAFGDLDSVYACLAEVAVSPYSRKSESRNFSALGTLLARKPGSPGADDLERASGLFAVAVMGLENPDVALHQLLEEIGSSSARWSADEYWMGVSLAVTLLGDRLIKSRAVHPRSEHLVSTLRGLIGRVDGFPRLPVDCLEAYEAAAAIARGRRASKREPIGVPIYELRATISFAVAWHVAGDHARMEAELVSARAQARSLGRWAGWMLVGVAHSQCTSPVAAEVWATASSAAGAGPAESLLAQTYIADALVEDGRRGDAVTLLERSLTEYEATEGDLGMHILTAKSDLARHLLALDEPERARALRQEVVEGCEALFGRGSPAVLDAQASLAATCYRMDDFPAAQVLEERVLDGWIAIAGEHHIFAANAKANLAATLGARDDYAAARTLQEDVVAIRCRDLGDEDPGTLLAKAELASTLEAQGDLEAARVLREEVLAAHREILGEDDPRTLGSEGALGGTFYRLNDYTAALPLFEHAARVEEERLGVTDPRTLVAKSNLAVTLEALEGFAAARPIREEVLTGCRQRFGDDRPETLSAKAALGATCFCLGDHAESLPLEREVADVRRKVLGPDHADTIAAEANLAATLEALDDLQAAQPLREHVLEVRRRTLGENDLITLAAESALVVTLHAARSYEAALSLAQHVADARAMQLGDDHLDTINARSNLATLQSVLNRHALAREGREQLLLAWRRLAGDDHPSTVDAEAALATAYFRAGDHGAARPLEEHVLRIRADTLGDDHVSTLGAKKNLATTLEQLGDLVAARTLRDDLCAASRRARGDDDPATLSAESKLAVTCARLGDYAAVLPLVKHVARIRSATLGDDDELSVAAKRNVAIALEALGDFAAARIPRSAVLTACRRNHGEDDPRTLEAELSLAGACARSSDQAAARPLLEHVTRSRSGALGDGDEATLSAMWRLAETLEALVEFREARGVREKIVAVHRRDLGEDHVGTVTAEAYLVVTCHHLRDYEASLPLARHVAKVVGELNGDDDEQTLRARANLAGTLEALGDFTEARSLREDVLARRRLKLGEDPGPTLAAEAALASNYARIGEHGLARPLQERVLAARVNHVGSSDELVVAAANDLAGTLEALGEAAAAEKLREGLGASAPLDQKVVERAS
jgi:tetratricopeptide (TPR) repeat protein